MAVFSEMKAFYLILAISTLPCYWGEYLTYKWLLKNRAGIILYLGYLSIVVVCLINLYLAFISYHRFRWIEKTGRNLNATEGAGTSMFRGDQENRKGQELNRKGNDEEGVNYLEG